MAGAGFTIASGHVRIEADVDNAQTKITNLVTKLVSVGPAAGGAATVVAGALGSITAAVVAAGAATGAFALAAKPQLTEVTETTKLYEAAQKAAADGASDAAEKQKAYEQALAKLPPATRETAVALGKLKTEQKAWSDSLASTTMPVFTKGINVLRAVLPQLTPLVKTAGGAFSRFMDQLKSDVNSGGFKAFMTGLNKAAKESLPNLLAAGRDVFRGIGGVIGAFLPHAGQASEKIAQMAKAFGDWAQNLGSSQGFKDFMTFVSQNGPKIVATLGNLATTAQKLWQAFSPLASIQLTVLAELSGFIAKLPPPVILALAAAIVAVKVAIMGFQIYAALTAPTMAPLIASTWAWTAALLANPLTWIIAGIVALIAVIVLIATKTDWFQKLWSVCWGAIKTAASAAWDWIKNVVSKGFDFLKNLFLNFTGPGLIIKHWDKIKSATGAAWQWVKDKVSSAINAVKSTVSSVTSAISSKVSSVWSSIKSGTSAAWSWIKGKITDGINGAKNAVTTAIGKIASAVSSIKGKVTGALSGAASFLYNSGKKIIQGLINGIKSMAGSVKNAVGNVLSGARNLLPFSPAKEGPFSGKGWTENSGASLMQGLATGIKDNSGLPYQSMSSALGGVSGATAVQPVAATGGTNTYNITINVDSKWDLSSPAERRAFAKLTVNEFADALRKQEKEQR